MEKCALLALHTIWSGDLSLVSACPQIFIIIMPEEKGVMQTSGVFMISVRRGRGAIGVEGVGCGGDGWAPSQKKIVPQNDKSGCILMQF